MVYLPHWPNPKHGSINLGLDRTIEILSRLNNPHLNLPPVVHVAGTNGKGSIIAFLEKILQLSGYSVHKYISPHLCNFNERIVLAGSEISDGDLFRLMEEVRESAEDLEGTFFEFTTAAAFLAFSRKKADVLLLETGMGGRLDSTNVVGNPMLSIIMPISFDHMEFLGDTLSKIAYEKAGIIKRNSNIVTSFQYKEAESVLLDKIIQDNANAYMHNRDWDFKVDKFGFQFIDIKSAEVMCLPEPSLFGIHQYINAATAVASVNILRKHFDISYDNIRQGIASAYWPARFEQIKNGKIFQMLPNNFELWIDGAHNISGAEMVAATIASKWTDKPVYLINGRTLGRDIAGFLYCFRGITDTVHCVKIHSEPKSEPPEVIAKFANELGFKAISYTCIYDAITNIVNENKKNGGRIIACGSLYLSGDIKKANLE
jgi:dihydrofolate synthase / folylpolyglutamate synthase